MEGLETMSREDGLSRLDRVLNSGEISPRPDAPAPKSDQGAA
jgi:hypothetical protein